MEQQASNQLPHQLHEPLKDFLVDKNLKQAAGSLRKVFFDYLRYTSDGPDLDFNEIVSHIEDIFDLLDLLNSEKVE